MTKCLPDVVGALLVDMAGLPGLPDLFADSDLIKYIVPLLEEPNPQVRIPGRFSMPWMQLSYMIVSFVINLYDITWANIHRSTWLAS